MDLVGEIRADSSIPIIVARARKNAKDRVEALSRGAYDYWTKPFDPTKMLLRSRTILNSEIPTPTTPSPTFSLPVNNTVAPKRDRRTASVRNPELQQTTPMPNPPAAVPPILLQDLECQRNQVCR